MSEEARNELNKMSIEDLYELLSRINLLKNNAKSNIVDIKPEDLKPKRKKRGSKN